MKTSSLLALGLAALCEAAAVKRGLNMGQLVTLQHNTNYNNTINSCGAFQGLAGSTASFESVQAVFTIPKLSLRKAQAWKNLTAVTPRAIISVGIDGILCPQTVRAGIYSTLREDGTQENLPFLEFQNKTHIGRSPSLDAGDTVGVLVSMETTTTALLHWEFPFDSLDFEADTDLLCGKTVSWQVEDFAPPKAMLGDYFPAFEPVHFWRIEGSRSDGVTVHLSNSSTFMGQSYCRGAISGAGNDEMIVTSSS